MKILSTVLVSWLIWHHVSINKVVNLTSPVFDFFSNKNGKIELSSYVSFKIKCKRLFVKI